MPSLSKKEPTPYILFNHYSLSPGLHLWALGILSRKRDIESGRRVRYICPSSELSSDRERQSLLHWVSEMNLFHQRSTFSNLRLCLLERAISKSFMSFPSIKWSHPSIKEADGLNICTWCPLRTYSSLESIEPRFSQVQRVWDPFWGGEGLSAEGENFSLQYGQYNNAICAVEDDSVSFLSGWVLGSHNPSA